jgi:hypothetical protein
MEELLLKLLEQAPAIGGVLVVLWMGKGIIEKVVTHFLAQITELNARYEKLAGGYEAMLARGNVLASQLHERMGEMNTGVRYMNEHLETCAKLVERIHEDNMRMRARDHDAN